MPAALKLNAELYPRTGWVPSSWSTDNCVFDPEDVESYVDLRLVSRVIYADVVKYLCSNNHIMLDRADILEHALGVPLGWPLGLLQCLRRLIIVLDDTIDDRISNTRVDKTLVYTLTSRKFKNFQPAWDRLIRLLASLPNCSNLELKLACNVEDANSARLLLQPLEQLHVAKCTIQLTGKRNPVHEAIARDAVLRCTPPNIRTQGCFRLLDLPIELRQHILSYTDLVTPFREVIWSPITKLDLPDGYQWRYRTCPTRSFCAARSFVFPVCPCWQPPTSVFLVCQAILQDARRTFYGSNRFVIIPPPSFAMKPTIRKERRFEASIFLTQVVPREGLSSLRSLEIHFPGREYSHLGISQKWLDDWERSIQYAAPLLKKLTLNLSMGCEGRVQRGNNTEDLQKSLQELYRVHEQIVRPLGQLRCLDGFFVNAWSYLNHEQWTETRAEQYFLDHAKKLEAAVMGSCYDSEARSKRRRRNNEWLRDRFNVWGY